MLRELRNNLAHEYPTMIDETIENLNYLFEQIPITEKILYKIKEQI
jgi:hypothetical protein